MSTLKLNQPWKVYVINCFWILNKLLKFTYETNGIFSFINLFAFWIDIQIIVTEIHTSNAVRISSHCFRQPQKVISLQLAPTEVDAI